MASSLDPSSSTLICEVAIGLLTALNFLNCAGWSEHLIIPAAFDPLSSAQTAVVVHLFSAARRFLSSDEVPFDAPSERSLLLERKLNYAGEQVSVRRELFADKVVPA